MLHVVKQAASMANNDYFWGVLLLEKKRDKIRFYFQSEHKKIVTLELIVVQQSVYAWAYVNIKHVKMIK